MVLKVKNRSFQDGYEQAIKGMRELMEACFESGFSLMDFMNHLENNDYPHGPPVPQMIERTWRSTDTLETKGGE